MPTRGRQAGERGGPASASERRRAARIVSRLARTYGDGHPARPAPEAREPLDELIFTVLSQNTSDVNRDRAWASLRARYPSWEEVVRARPEALARAIAAGGLSNTKAPRIQGVLREIRSREGAFTLERLRALPDGEVRAYLTTLPGVGPKTAACVLAFSLGRAAVPVDTHVHRVASRLGLVPRGAPAAEAQLALEALVPPRHRVGAHLDLIAHGRSICRAPTPRCGSCVLAELCPSAPVEAAGVRAGPGPGTEPGAGRRRPTGIPPAEDRPRRIGGRERSGT